ncbi:hypothetical protein [Thioclava kandeliae]|uniref:Pectinesterase inhibitor domain-containing protein n=1 Tax=Thioclava kandeliae TaxID=3070818 RepID=A0ABV1SLQ0_9RHOB
MLAFFNDRVSLLELIGLEVIGHTLLLVSLAIFLSPVLAGLEFSGFKVPAVPNNRRPLVIGFAAVLFLASAVTSMPLVQVSKSPAVTANMMNDCAPIWQRNDRSKERIAICSEAFLIRHDALIRSLGNAKQAGERTVEAISFQLNEANLKTSAAALSDQLNRARRYCFQTIETGFISDADGCDFSSSLLKTLSIAYDEAASRMEVDLPHQN